MNTIPVAADEARLTALLADLRTAQAEESAGIAREIRHIWGQSGSPSMDLLLRRGRDALEAGETSLAIDHLTALTDHAPDFAEGYALRAQAYFVADMYGPAIADLEQVLALNPNHFDALRGMATILELLERPDEAYAAYEQVLAIHPHQADVLESMDRLKNKLTGTDL